MSIQPKPRTALAVVIGACLGISAVQPAWADGDRVQQLESRVAELEAMIRQLVDQQNKDRATTNQQIQAATAQAQSAQQEVAAVAAKVEPVVTKQASDSKHKFKFGGYIKVDTLVSSYDDGDIAQGSIGRDFYVPSTIPVGGAEESTDIDYHAKQSRFYFGTDHELDNGDKVSSYLEFDFLVTDGGDERVSNSYLPRMRHAFLKYNNWLLGQTWSTFMDVSTLPETLDFVGPAESTTFVRQAMIRYTKGGFSIALENPETTVTPFGGGARIDADDSSLPDLAANYRYTGDFGHIQLSGLLRRLDYENVATNVDDRTTSWGLSLSGILKLGKDDLHWMVTHGDGLGRYVGLNAANGAVLTDTNDLKAIGSTGGFVSYRHWWNDQWRSTAVLSYQDIDNDTRYTGLGVTDNIWSGHINLLYSPVPNVTFGMEYIYAERELENGLDGSLSRFQFSGRYDFKLF